MEMEESIAEAGVDEQTDTETAVETETQPETETDDTDQDAGEGEAEEASGEEPDYEEIEFDFGGKKLAIGKGQPVEAVAGELQDFAKSLEAGFTQKTQALAEQRKSLEAQTEAIQKISSLSGEAMDMYTKANALQQELSEYDAIPQQQIDQWWNEDPVESQKLADRIARKRSEFGNLQNALNQKVSALTYEQSQQRDRFMEQGRKQIEKSIKGFASKASEVVDYVVEKYGIPRERAEEWPLNPAGTEMAYKAMLYDKMNNNLKTASQSKVKPAASIKAMKTKSGSAAKSPAEMSMSEYVKWRSSQKED